MDANCCRPNVSRQTDATTIVMEEARPKARFLLGAFLTLWLVAWGVAEYQVGHALFLGLPYQGPLQLKVGHSRFRGVPDKALAHPDAKTETWHWFEGWSVGGLAVATVLCLMLISGPYVLTLTRDQLTVSKRIGNFTRTRRWPWREVAALQLAKIGYDGYSIRLICPSTKSLLLPPSDLSSITSVLEEIRAFLAANHLDETTRIAEPR